MFSITSTAFTSCLLLTDFIHQCDINKGDAWMLAVPSFLPSLLDTENSSFHRQKLSSG